MRRLTIACLAVSLFLAASGADADLAMQHRWSIEMTLPSKEVKTFLVVRGGAQLPPVLGWSCSYGAMTQTAATTSPGSDVIESVMMTCARADVVVGTYAACHSGIAASYDDGALILYDVKTERSAKLDLYCKSF